MSSSFAEVLRAFREERSLTQEELAERAGITVKAVGALERGERRRPYPHTVRSLADALDLDGDERAALVASVPVRGPVERGRRSPPGHRPRGRWSAATSTSRWSSRRCAPRRARS